MSQRKKKDVRHKEGRTRVTKEGEGRVALRRGWTGVTWRVCVQRAGHAAAAVQRAWHAPLELSSQHVIKVTPKDGLTIHELDPVLLACVLAAIRRQLLDLLLHVLSAGRDRRGRSRPCGGGVVGAGERGG